MEMIVDDIEKTFMNIKNESKKIIEPMSLILYLKMDQFRSFYHLVNIT